MNQKARHPKLFMPKLSIIIPTYKRADLLEKCLLSIVAQKEFADCEVIIVNDSQDKDTKLLVERFHASHPNILYIASKHQGQSVARNIGLGKAHAGLITFLDDDCVACNDWIRNIIKAHSRYDEAIAGSIVPLHKGLVAEFLQGLEARADMKYDRIFYPSLINNNSYKSHQLKGMKFDVEFFPTGEDVDFNMRLAKKGVQTRFVHNIIVLHNYKTALLQMLKQQHSFGLCRPKIMRLSNDYPFERNPFALYVLKRLATPIVDPWLRLSFALRHKRKHALMYLPLGYLQQIAYWSGFIRGVIKRI